MQVPSDPVDDLAQLTRALWTRFALYFWDQSLKMSGGNMTTTNVIVTSPIDFELVDDQSIRRRVKQYHARQAAKARRNAERSLMRLEEQMRLLCISLYAARRV